MTTDVFIAGLVGMIVIALVIGAMTSRREPYEESQRLDQNKNAALGEK